MLTHWYEASTEDARIEIVNNERTYQYAQAMNLRGVLGTNCSCASSYACDPGPFVCRIDSDDVTSSAAMEAIFGCNSKILIPSNASSPGAPWWDERVPGSYNFAGFYCTGVSGWDSTFSREQYPRTLTGTSVGVRRRDGRSLTFDGVLIAGDIAGLEFGLSYYDTMLTTLGECGFFSLYTATQCPDPGETEAEAARHVRHLRRVTVIEGPKMIDTRVVNGTAYGRVQFTLMSEMPWIFTEPVFALQRQVFLESEATLNLRFRNAWEVSPGYTQTRDVLTSRQRYGVEIARDGSVCRIGNWDWSATQLAGGDGIVVVSSAVDAQYASLEQIEQAAEVEKKECPRCEVILNYDLDTGAKTFETLRWDTKLKWNSDGSLPCDCEITIVGIRRKNDSYDGTAQGAPNSSNAPWSYETVDGTGTEEDCCFVELFFSGPTGGEWQPVPAEGKLKWDPAGRDTFTLEQNFPPRSCSLRVKNDCPDLEKEVEQEGIYYQGPDNLTYFGVRGPVEYYEDGSWVAASLIGSTTERVSGCLPGQPCADGDTSLGVIPYITNRDEISSCVSDRICNIIIDPATNTWKPSGWFHNKIDQFPAPGCEFVIANPQKTDKVIVTEIYEVESGACGTSSQAIRKVFPSFESDCWEPIFVPEAISEREQADCFCLPIYAVDKCGALTNPSATYPMAAAVTVRTGVNELRNMQIKAWVRPFHDLPTPCEDPDFWSDKPPDFTLRVPHLPAGYVLNIDSATKQGTLQAPGGFIEPAIRYVSDKNGGPFDFLYVDPCDTVYFTVEADKYNTAHNLNVDFYFVNYYSASGSLLPASTV